MKLELPEGIGVGNLAVFVYPPNDGFEEGDTEGGILDIKASRVTVRFTYKDASVDETAVINVGTGMDETNHAPVTDIKVPRR